MRPSLKLSALVLLLAVSTAGAKEKDKDHDESLILMGDHRVVITVPAGYIYSSGRDDNGVLMVKVTDAKEKSVLQVAFVPDPDGLMATEKARMDKLAVDCQHYAEESVEKSYNFTSLAPRLGSGTFCVFADASLVGKEPPKDEWRNVTTGIKSWSGWCCMFTVLSNDTTSKEYQTAMRLVKDSFEELPPVSPKL